MMNNQDLFEMLSMQPWKGLKPKYEVHNLCMANRNDLLYSVGGVFQPWTFGYQGRPSNHGDGLANLYDISADYALAKHIPVTPSWGYAQGRAVIRSIYSNGKDGLLVFIEFNFKL